jgi:hypothetical protein
MNKQPKHQTNKQKKKKKKQALHESYSDYWNRSPPKTSNDLKPNIDRIL